MMPTDIETLMQRYARLCWKVASHFAPMANEQDLEEIVADVFIDFWRFPSRYNGEKGSVKKYLSVLARNKAADFSRRHKLVTELPETLESTEAGPAERLETLERDEALHTAMGALPAQDAELLQRRYGDGEKPAEIAASLGKDVKSVKNSLYRAKNKLKEMLS
ncbi:MAG: sigma-70 family RNA polymerase sigma factor [Gallionellaceae bacterium]|jgi:RNA polymerase sigma-70 factor (ECF subfamily)|nr:sigma-70 family RNA polymerase sigma factor [Gallionellaceae bacterium]